MPLSDCGIGRPFWRDEVFTDTRIAYDNDPACSVLTRDGARFVALAAVLVSQFGSLPSLIFSGNCGTKLAKIFDFSLMRHCSRWD